MITLNHLLRICLSIVLLILWTGCPILSFAKPIQEIHGVASVEIKSKHFHVQTDQVIVIDRNQARFVGMDDFGGVSFEILFQKNELVFFSSEQIFQTKGEKLKKILSLPLSQDEFLKIIKHELPIGFVSVLNPTGEIWSDPRNSKKKKLRIHFSEFMNRRGQRYPQRIRMECKKNFINLKWIKVDFR